MYIGTIEDDYGPKNQKFESFKKNPWPKLIIIVFFILWVFRTFRDVLSSL